MIAIKSVALRDKFKAYCDKVVKGGETVIVTRKNNENVVIVSEREYNKLLKAARNAEYLAGIDESFAQIERGEVVIKTLEELREYEK